MLGDVFWLVIPTQARVIGFGDVKLALSAGATPGWCGWSVLLLGLLAGYLAVAPLRRCSLPFPVIGAALSPPVRARTVQPDVAERSPWWQSPASGPGTGLTFTAGRVTACEPDEQPHCPSLAG
ncbi:hypothetical protein ACFVEN_25095 [Streptomyces sp. NPDC057681]|uniref:hypothetical protein n=1 Tax=Streptomyces sp. NPDC057681 TaxID=3346209 RepID=UPI0036A9CC6C